MVLSSLSQGRTCKACETPYSTPGSGPLGQVIALDGLLKIPGELDSQYIAQAATTEGYSRRRHHIKANRAGTRGFRAPEVLFKCEDQNGGKAV